MADDTLVTLDYFFTRSGKVTDTREEAILNQLEINAKKAEQRRAREAHKRLEAQERQAQWEAERHKLNGHESDHESDLDHSDSGKVMANFEKDGSTDATNYLS